MTLPEGVKRVENAVYYEITITVTPDEYYAIKSSADWESGGSISAFVKDAALGKRRRGC